MSGPDVVVVSGEARYSDPWHDFPGTSRRVAEILGDHGLRVEICGAASSAPRTARLLVVNAGGGSQPVAPVHGDGPDRWRSAVLDHALAGGPVLALHAATNTFYTDDRWASVIGGRWVAGTSMHPPGGPATVQVVDVEHPITAGLPSELDVVDERYSYLDVHDTAVPLVTQVHDAVVHPIVWVNQRGPAGVPVRAAVDCLGHDVTAYGETRAELLRREVDWLLG